MALPYDRIIRDRQIPVNKLELVIQYALQVLEGHSCSVRSRAAICMKHKQVLQSKVSVIIEGQPNQLYAQGMQLFEQYEEAYKYFTEEKQKDNDASKVPKHLHLQGANVGKYLTDKYALWLYFRIINENALQGTGGGIGSGREGITL